MTREGGEPLTGGRVSPPPTRLTTSASSTPDQGGMPGRWALYRELRWRFREYSVGVSEYSVIVLKNIVLAFQRIYCCILESIVLAIQSIVLAFYRVHCWQFREHCVDCGVVEVRCS